MKLYREVKEDEAKLCAFPYSGIDGEIEEIWLEPIEITEEEIEEILDEELDVYETLHIPPRYAVYGIINATKAILSKLKGE